MPKMSEIILEKDTYIVIKKLINYFWLWIQKINRKYDLYYRDDNI